MNPIFVLAAEPGEVYAIWQVETDNQPGDLTGAWLVTAEGVEGYAKDIAPASAEQALRSILRFPTLVAVPGLADPLDLAGAEVGDYLRGIGVEVIDWPATEAAADAALAAARETFAEQIGGRQPAWGRLTPLSELFGPALSGPQRLGNPAAEQALATARALQGWLRAWHEFDKLRARRLHSEVTGVPLQYQA